MGGNQWENFIQARAISDILILIDTRLWQEQIDERPFPNAQYYFVIIQNVSVILTIFNNKFALEDFGSGFQCFFGK